jgi:hypothetical protein
MLHHFSNALIESTNTKLGVRYAWLLAFANPSASSLSPSTTAGATALHYLTRSARERRPLPRCIGKT